MESIAAKQRQVQAEFARKAPFRGNPVEVADEEHLEENDWVDGWATGVAVKRSAQRPDEGEVDDVRDQSEQVVIRHEPVQ